MDVVERLSLEAATAGDLLACEHRHRYEFAASLCSERKVLDLCCGSGYGSEILAATASAVVGVDVDVGTIDMARATVGKRAGVSFEAADAVAYLRAAKLGRFELIVCFEGLEHLAELDDALALLREHADAGSRLVLSVPNSKLFEEVNPYHRTDFGYEEAVEAFSDFPAVTVLPQFLAEGSLITPPGATGTEVSVDLRDRDEPAYANHFIICSNFPPSEVASAHHGHLQVAAAPAYNRHMKALERAYAELRQANARLARQRLGKSASAAASYLAKTETWRRRAEAAEARVADLEGRLTPPARLVPRATAVAGPPAPPPERCMNTWDDRYRRAKENLIPWIETAVGLRGKTVVEYGCGNAPVSCAFGERVERHVGLDVDADAVETGRRMLRERGADNVELHVHPVEEVRDALSAFRGEADVVLLYAVLEHLTLDERLDVLRRAREVAQPDGHIVVCETPNRLFPIDHHTSQLPFFTMLPDELAVRLYDHSRRPDFLNAITEAMLKGEEAARERLRRWGRGLSYHEFELVFGDLSHYVAASNYEPVLFPERPVAAEELALARLMERYRPDLAPVWSRAWLDLVLAAWPLEATPRFLRPWSMETVGSPGASWTAAERIHLPDPATPLRVRPPRPSPRLVVGAEVPAGTWAISASTASTAEALRVEVEGQPGQGHYASFELPQPAELVEVGLSRPGDVFFVGCED